MSWMLSVTCTEPSFCPGLTPAFHPPAVTAHRLPGAAALSVLTISPTSPSQGPLGLTSTLWLSPAQPHVSQTSVTVEIIQPLTVLLNFSWSWLPACSEGCLVRMLIYLHQNTRSSLNWKHTKWKEWFRRKIQSSAAIQRVSAINKRYSESLHSKQNLQSFKIPSLIRPPKHLASLFCSPNIFMIFHKKQPGKTVISTQSMEYIMSPDTMKIK